MAAKKPKAASRKAPAAPRAKSARKPALLVATRKGAWLYHGDAARRT